MMVKQNLDKVSLIKSHAFKSLAILNGLRPKKRNYIGKEMSIVTSNDTESLRYLDIKPENQIDGFSCFLKKNYAVISNGYSKPITIGLDASYGYQNRIIRGNACYVWGTVLTSMADGNLSEEVLNEIRKLNRYVLMVSNKVFDDKHNTGVLIDHHLLQDNFFNMLKVVAEGKMIAEPLAKIVKTLASYRYTYTHGDSRRVIVIKDGPLLSGFFEPFGDALFSGKFPSRFEDEHNIYNTVLHAGLQGIPVIGITKHPAYSILAQHYGENDVLDYSIVKQIAEGDTYFYVGPFERKHKRNANFRIFYYYLYLEDRFSPLRLEILPDLLPRDTDPNKLVEDILVSLKASNEGEFNNNGEDYKLPVCLAIADQTSREIVKQKSAELAEKMEEICRMIPGAILDRRN